MVFTPSASHYDMVPSRVLVPKTAAQEPLREAQEPLEREGCAGRRPAPHIFLLVHRSARARRVQEVLDVLHAAHVASPLHEVAHQLERVDLAAQLDDAVRGVDGYAALR